MIDSLRRGNIGYDSNTLKDKLYNITEVFHHAQKFEQYLIQQEPS